MADSTFSGHTHVFKLIVIFDGLIRDNNFAGPVDETIDIEFHVGSHTIAILIHPISAIRIELPTNFSYIVLEVINKRWENCISAFYSIKIFFGSVLRESQLISESSTPMR